MATNSNYNDLINENENASDLEKNYIMGEIHKMKQKGYKPNKIENLIHNARKATSMKLARNKLILPTRQGMSSYKRLPKRLPKGGSRRSTKRSNRKANKTRKH